MFFIKAFSSVWRSVNVLNIHWWQKQMGRQKLLKLFLFVQVKVCPVWRARWREPNTNSSRVPFPLSPRPYKDWSSVRPRLHIWWVHHSVYVINMFLLMFERVQVVNKKTDKNYAFGQNSSRYEYCRSKKSVACFIIFCYRRWGLNFVSTCSILSNNRLFT